MAVHMKKSDEEIAAEAAEKAKIAEKVEKLKAAILVGNADEINNLASELFITSSGRVNFSNIELLEAALPGVRVFPAEQDSFGWLVGGIRYMFNKYFFG